MKVSMSVGRMLSRHGGRAVPFALQFVLIGFVIHTQHGTGVWLAVVTLGLLSLVVWLLSLRTLHFINATPISRIASAAQGFVALKGRGRALAGTPLLSPFNGLPVLWYRLRIEERDSNDRWNTSNEEESDACLLLEDTTGQCVIDPQGAEVHTALRETEQRGDLRYTHWCIIEHTPLFVLGDFRTLHGESLTQTEREAVRDILAEWKRDRSELLRRFDLNGDGDINEQEWSLARSEAQREARRQRIEADRAAAAHVLRKPATRHPFVICAVKPWRMKLPHRLACTWHAALFLLCCAALAVLQQTGSLGLR